MMNVFKTFMTFFIDFIANFEHIKRSKHKLVVEQSNTNIRL